MLVATVVGHVVATAKHPALSGLRLMIVRPASLQGERSGPDLVAADSVGAGAGEQVLVVVEGRSAGDATARGRSPIDAAIVGIVDCLDTP